MYKILDARNRMRRWEEGGGTGGGRLNEESMYEYVDHIRFYLSFDYMDLEM